MKIKRKTFVGGILATLCACTALTFGAVFCGNNNKVSAEAAVAPPAVTFETASEVMVYTTRYDPSTNVPYTSFVSSVDTVSASFSDNVATVNRPSGGLNFVIGYVPVKSEIEVPAMTEYKVDYKIENYLIKYITGDSKATVYSCLFYFGNTADDPSATDPSATLSFKPTSAGITSSTGASYTALGTLSATTSAAAQSTTVNIPTITYTNNTNGKKSFTAYFGFVGVATHANKSTSANGLDTTATFSGDITVTPISEPKVDVKTATYNGQYQNFTFTYNNQCASVTKAEYTNLAGITTTTYDKVTSKGTNPLDANDVMTAKESGTYKLYFTINENCGAVWNNATANDPDTKSVSFTINPKVLTPPSGTVTSTYNGLEQTLDDLATDKQPNWYNSTLYTDPSIIEMNDKVTDAGEHTISVKLLSENYAWSDDTTNTSDTRTFTFKVNKKELEVEFEDNGGVKVAKFKDTNEIYTRDSGDKYPKLITKYSKNNNAGSATFTSPNSTGTWYAHAFLENAESCNYSVSNAGSQFELNKIAVAYPKLSASSSASEEYNGEEQEFTFEGYDPDLMTCTAPTGAISFDGTTLKIKNAGKYKPVFTLKNNSLYAFSGTEPEVEITPKPIVIDSDGANATEWERGTVTTLTFEIPTQLCSGDSTVELVATYSLNGGDEQNGTIAVSGKTGTVTISKGFAKGNYELTVKTADGENYSGTCTYNFEITAQGRSLGNNDIKWNIAGKPYVTDDYDDGKAVVEIEYTGTPLSLSNVSVNFNSASDASYLEQDGDLTGTFINAVNVGEYTATFKIKAKSSDETCSDGPFTLTIKIVPKKLDFSKAEWEYSNDGGTTWNKITATNKPSYTGDPITVRISPDYMKGLGLDIDKGDYTVNYTALSDPTEQGEKKTTVDLTIINANYTTADESGYENISYDWEITARALTYTWNGTQAVEVGANAFEFPAVKFDDGNDYSKYYDYVYTVNGTDYTLEELKTYIAENWSETTPVSGMVAIKLKDGVTEVNINSTSRNFTTGAPKTALTVAVTGSGAEYGKVDFALSVVRGDKDERARVEVTVAGGTLTEAKTFNGNAAELVAFVNGLDVGKYTITVSLKAGNEASYVLTESVFDFEVVVRKIVVPQVTKDIVYKGEYINVVDYLDSNYNASIMSMLSGYTNKTAGSYTVTFKLNSANYMWVEPTGAEPMNKLFAKALFVNEISIDNSALTATLDWSISKIVLATDGWNLKSKTGASLNALAAYQDMITANGLDVTIGYRYYDTNGNLVEEPVLKGGEKFIVEAYLVGEDAANFEFADGTDELKSVSARKDYTVPQSAVAAFFGSALNFAKANWLWLVIAAVVLLFLIILICIIVSAKKKKRKREELAEQRRLEKEERDREEREERKREQEERRREDREERMARMNQQQMMMPQMMPQMMGGQMPQMGGGSMAMGGGGSSNELAELKAEVSALRAAQEAMRAEQTAKELAEIKALHTAEQQIAQAKTDMRVENLTSRLGGEQLISGGVTAATLVEMVTAAMEKVLDRREKPAAQATAEAKAEEAGKDTPVCPPDAVMTTVTTTKIDTTKKPAQTAERAQAPAPAVRTVVRNVVAPMPVDDGRVFDVGGFYKPADPMTDMDLTDDENKE
ncbi:MAG: hypothetical protein K2I17_06320 [Clostridia bacterium]|nr:hypothetical protein [Clostridia bacterium]